MFNAGTQECKEVAWLCFKYVSRHSQKEPQKSYRSVGYVVVSHSTQNQYKLLLVGNKR